MRVQKTRLVISFGDGNLHLQWVVNGILVKNASVPLASDRTRIDLTGKIVLGGAQIGTATVQPT